VPTTELFLAASAARTGASRQEPGVEPRPPTRSSLAGHGRDFGGLLPGRMPGRIPRRQGSLQPRQAAPGRPEQPGQLGRRASARRASTSGASGSPSAPSSMQWPTSTVNRPRMLSPRTRRRAGSCRRRPHRRSARMPRRRHWPAASGRQVGHLLAAAHEHRAHYAGAHDPDVATPGRPLAINCGRQSPGGTVTQGRELLRPPSTARSAVRGRCGRQRALTSTFR
jgi:hypothetical protein